VAFGGLGIVGEYWGGTYDWPSLMGNPVALFHNGLRGFWGKVWHQLFREVYPSMQETLVSLLIVFRCFSVLEKLSQKLAWFQLSRAGVMRSKLAFCISGIFHAATLPRDISAIDIKRGAHFFWIQGLCVQCEIVASFVATKLVTHTRKRPFVLEAGLGIVWVAWTVIVFYHTVLMIVDEFFKVSRQTGNKPIFLFPVPQL